MNDIQNQDDLYLLVDKFYKKLLADDKINYIFINVIPINLEEHLPLLVTFWSQIIFGTGGYHHNLTQIHLDINSKSYLSKELFDIWITHFEKAIDENFEGDNCERLKKEANQLSTLLQIKIAQQNSN